ncbi:MAG: hypothetical protein V4737_08905, partial [Curtobacterium sp.]
MVTESPVSSSLTTASTRRQGRVADRAGAGTTSPRRRPRSDLWLALVFIAPASVGFLLFLAWPTVRGIYL